MNSWQLAQQIRHELQLVSWEQGSADLVFGSRGVLVYAGALSEEQHPPGFPFALVTVGSGSPDPDDPDLIEQQFGIIAAVQVVGDPMGQAVRTTARVPGLVSPKWASGSGMRSRS